MNYKVLLTTLLILTAIATIFICIARPQMHKSVLVYSSEFKIVPQNEIEIEVQNIPTITVVDNTPINTGQGINITSDQNISTQQVTTQGININQNQNYIPQKITTQGVNINANQNFAPQKVTTQMVNVNPNQGIKIASNQGYPPQKITTQGIKTTTPATKPSNQGVKVNYPQLENTNVKTTSPQIDIQKILDNNKKIQAANQHVTPGPITAKNVTTTPAGINTNKIAQTPVTPKVVTTPAKTIPTTIPSQNTILTPQQEQIAWQVWRSNLQNKIMQDVRLPNVPQGTIFKFSFDVDRYGKITNVHTTSTNSAYTPYAIQYIAPVIKSYQGRSILNFPSGSKRTTTEFIGSFRINNSSNKYSTTQDYRDTERITK